MDSIYKFLAKWNSQADSFAKVQGVYAVLAVALLFLAAFVSLAQSNLGQTILFYAFIATLTFIGNGVIWAIVKTFVVPHIEDHTTVAPKPQAKPKAVNKKK